MAALRVEHVGTGAVPAQPNLGPCHHGPSWPDETGVEPILRDIDEQLGRGGIERGRWAPEHEGGAKDHAEDQSAHRDWLRARVLLISHDGADVTSGTWGAWHIGRLG